MARRIEANGGGAAGSPASGLCRICGGGIVVDEEPGRPRDLPRRLVCRKCGAEYGTTRMGRFWDAEKGIT